MSHDNENKKGCMCGCGGDANNRYCQTHHCSEMCRQYNGGKSANGEVIPLSTPPSEVSTWTEIQKIAKERDSVIYSMGADRARGLKTTKQEVAKDNLGVLLNDKIKAHISFVREEAKREERRRIRDILDDMDTMVITKKAYKETKISHPEYHTSKTEAESFMKRTVGGVKAYLKENLFK